MTDALALLLAPLLGGALVLATHVPLGEQVLRRGIVFIDLAIAQIAALGVLVTATVTGEAWIIGLAGSAAALAGVALVAWLGRLWPERREALIGVVYVCAAVLALLWVSADPRGGQRLATMLSGDVLWVSFEGLLPLALATVPFLVLQVLRPSGWLDGGGFHPWFAVLVSLSVPLLGLYLVFTTLIVPALLRLARPQLGQGATVAIGVLAYALGLLASFGWDLPSGPCVVIALVLGGVVAGVTLRTPGRRV